MHKLPGFRLDEYVDLLAALRERGYSIHPVTEMKQPADSRRVFLRHDVDILPSAAVTMGEKEADGLW